VDDPGLSGRGGRGRAEARHAWVASPDKNTSQRDSFSSASPCSLFLTHLPLSLPPSLPSTLPNSKKKQYEDGSAPALALQATIDRTEKRFANYGKAGLLCGTDGLPHLIADPGLALRYGHAGETLIPTVGFLYVAGWIGYVGREYLNIVAKSAKPTEKEIIIDVPLALSLAWKGAAWPARAVAELRNGTLLEKDENITVSPR
jgi:hypothetical protein